jgi:Lipopolysaccharide assembly protein A domain
VLRKLVVALMVVPLGALLVALAVVNRKPTIFILDPFGGAEARLSLEAPLFLFLLGAFALGLIIGGIATWLGQGKWRRTARAQSREARDLRIRRAGWKRSSKALSRLHNGCGSLPTRMLRCGRLGGPDWHRVAPREPI